MSNPVCPLTAEECHVLLDVVNGTPHPWEQYTTEPADDPKASEAGWNRTLSSAVAKLTQALDVLLPDCYLTRLDPSHHVLLTVGTSQETSTGRRDSWKTSTRSV